MKTTASARASDVQAALKKVANPARAKDSQRFFKTGPGEYGEGDKFLGITVPQQRLVAREFRGLPVKEALRLLDSPWHEHRLTGLIILVDLYKRGDARQKQQVFDGYLAHTKGVNNWDLVDSSAPYIVGPHIVDHPMPLLRTLVSSKNIWERRMGVVATFALIREKQSAPTLWAAKALLEDKHDLMHKAVGWMLRELGQRVDEKLLLGFLDEHAAVMPRTMLRYAIERLGPAEKSRYMKAGK